MSINIMRRLLQHRYNVRFKSLEVKQITVYRVEKVGNELRAVEQRVFVELRDTQGRASLKNILNPMAEEKYANLPTKPAMPKNGVTIKFKPSFTLGTLLGAGFLPMIR